MLIIAGKARGVQLATPKGKDIRPTLDRVRESVFNILAPQLGEDCRFLDLFAGTGANGIEALSRGADEAVMADASAASIRLIEENLARARCQNRGKVLRRSLPKDLASMTKALGAFNLIYADPPYGFTEYRELLTGVQPSNLLVADGIFMMEHHKKVLIEFPEVKLQLVQQRVYGNTAVSFFGPKTTM